MYIFTHVSSNISGKNSRYYEWGALTLDYKNSPRIKVASSCEIFHFFMKLFETWQWNPTALIKLVFPAT